MPSVASTNERPNSPGVLISFEGLDGVGKTTQIGLVENALHAQGRETLRLREPGATRLGEAVRELLLDKQDLDISPMAELLLFEAARAQLIESVIQPALERGCVVLCDRFYDSTVAYQGHRSRPQGKRACLRGARTRPHTRARHGPRTCPHPCLRTRGRPYGARARRLP